LEKVSQWLEASCRYNREEFENKCNLTEVGIEIALKICGKE
jgi:hypothetical protein